MREIRLSGSVESVVSNHDPNSDSPSISTTRVGDPSEIKSLDHPTSVGARFGGTGALFSVTNDLRAGQLPCLHYIVERTDRNSTSRDVFISTAESAPAGIAALVPVGSAPELSHKRTAPRRSFRACGIYRHALNAPGNNLPVRHVPAPRRYAP